MTDLIGLGIVIEATAAQVVKDPDRSADAPAGADAGMLGGSVSLSNATPLSRLGLPGAWIAGAVTHDLAYHRKVRLARIPWGRPPDGAVG